MQFVKRGSLYVPDHQRQWIVPPTPERDMFRYRRYLERWRKEIQQPRPELSFTFVNSGSGAGAGSSGTIATGSVTGVTAGDMVIVGIRWDSTDTTVSCSDGGSVFTDAFLGAHVGSSGVYFCSFLYTLATASTGSKTYTVTFGANRTFRNIIALAYTPTSAVTLDGTPKGTYATSGTTITSGNVTTTGTDGIGFGFYGDFSGAAAFNSLINGVTRDRQVDSGGSIHSSLWAKSYAAGFTGQAQAEIFSGGPDWICLMAAFKITTSTAFVPLVGGPGGHAGMPLAGGGGGLAG